MRKSERFFSLSSPQQCNNGGGNMFAVKTMRLLSVGAAVALVGLTGTAQAQEVSATKTAPATGVLNNMTANLQLRHNTKISGEAEKNVIAPSVQLRSNISATMFKEKVDSLLVIAGTKNTSTTQVVERRPELYNNFNLIVADNYGVKPYINLFLPSAGSGTDGDVGINLSANTNTLNVPGGTLSLAAEGYFHASLSSRPQDARVTADATTRERFGLATGDSADEGVLDAGKDDPSYAAVYAGIATYKVAAVKGLEFSPQIWFTNTYDPVYSMNADGTRNVNFVNTPVVETLAKVSYAINDSVKLVNEAVWKHQGFYSSRVNDLADMRFLNVAYVSYTLF